VHAVTFDCVEYMPTLHVLHELAPPPRPVLVIDPASHKLHLTLPFGLLAT
jgi:hypothetical protein